MKYRDLDYAVKCCLAIWEDQPHSIIWLGISDLKSAFRVIPGRPDQWKFLMMKARHPQTGELFFFADKALPFEASISCSLYTEFSNALTHIITYYINRRFRVVNYLDSFLFIGTSESQCNNMVRSFIELCNYIGVPIANDMIVWASSSVKFLG